MSAISDLQDRLSYLGQHLHALILARQAAQLKSDDALVGSLGLQIQDTATQYNVVVGQLRAIEGPSDGLVMLDQVADVAIAGAKTGAVAVVNGAGTIIGKAGEVLGSVKDTAVKTIDAVGDVATGFGSLAKVFPLILVAVVVVIGVGLYRGTLKFKAPGF